MTPGLELVDRDLWDVVQDLELPLVLVDLSDVPVTSRSDGQRRLSRVVMRSI
jgi:hypothetical protein